MFCRPQLRIRKSLVAVFGVLLNSAPVHADLVCGYPNEAAKALTRSLRQHLPPGAQAGVFRVAAVKRNDALLRYRIEYRLSESNGLAFDLPAPSGELEESLTALAANKGADLELSWHSGGSGCCLCRYLITRSESQGFKLFATDEANVRVPAGRWKPMSLKANAEILSYPEMKGYLVTRVR